MSNLLNLDDVKFTISVTYDLSPDCQETTSIIRVRQVQRAYF